VTDTHWVTLAPPTLSAIQPPTGRMKAPINGPIQANVRAEGPSGFTMSWVMTPSTMTCWKPKMTLIARANPAEYPMKLPKVIV